jgi:S1-C subfamily serine protease
MFGVTIIIFLLAVVIDKRRNKFMRTGPLFVEQNYNYYNSDIDSFFVQQRDTNQTLTEEERRNIKIYETLSPAVVNITTYKTEYLRYFFDIYPQQREGQGSGVIFNKQGYILTNHHVVGNADRVTVSLSQDEKDFEATLVGTDPANDLAILKIKDPPNDLTIIPLGTSNNLQVGQKVYAIGNPFGFNRTLTSGIISALGRPLKTENGNIIEGAIQTDASINPGNSGGPLIDSFGKLIGINTMIVSPSGGSVGIGFAIPIDTIKEIIPELVEYGYVKRGWIDATFLPITPRIARSLNYHIDYGLMIMVTAKNGEAYNAGLRGGNERAIYGQNVIYIGGDIIVAVDKIKINVPVKENSLFKKMLCSSLT